MKELERHKKAVIHLHHLFERLIESINSLKKAKDEKQKNKLKSKAVYISRKMGRTESHVFHTYQKFLVFTSQRFQVYEHNLLTIIGRRGVIFATDGNLTKQIKKEDKNIGTSLEKISMSIKGIISGLSDVENSINKWKEKRAEIKEKKQKQVEKKK